LNYVHDCVTLNQEKHTLDQVNNTHITSQSKLSTES